MALKFSVFRPRTTLPVFTFYSPPRSAAKPLLSYSTAAAVCFSSLPYGPSLRKGHPLELKKCPCSGDNIAYLDEAAFVRVFDISAVRVPSDVCSTLENRLRGHLLNWPRIRNIARVAGDEIDEQIRDILPQSVTGTEDGGETLVALNRRIYGKSEVDGEPLNAVLHREKLAKTFNSRGYANFRNLAKISRPKKKKKKKTEDNGEKGQMKGVGRNELALVEVVEEEESDSEDLSRLLGEDFPPRPKWRGSTRLLLLGEQYANTSIDELPEAIKVYIFNLGRSNIFLLYFFKECWFVASSVDCNTWLLFLVAIQFVDIMLESVHYDLAIRVSYENSLFWEFFVLNCCL